MIVHDQSVEGFLEGLERAARMVSEHTAENPSQWVAIESTAVKIVGAAERLRRWNRQAGGTHVEGPALLRW